MDRKTYQLLENHMKQMMKDAAHDQLHVYRVLNLALEIAEHYETVDRDILIASCLLHDIGRQAQFDNPAVCHAAEGGKLAYVFLNRLGWPEARCSHVRSCVTTHRFRSDNPPQSLEAKILFDADKLDVTGALGIARSLVYEGTVGEPLYVVDGQGRILDGTTEETPPSFLREYHFKLSKLYDRFYTPEAERIAQPRKKLMTEFYDELIREIQLNNLENRIFGE